MFLNYEEAIAEAGKQGIKVLRNPSREQIEQLKGAIEESKVSSKAVDGWFILLTGYSGICVRTGDNRKHYIGISADVLNNKQFAVFQIMHEVSHAEVGFSHNAYFTKVFMDQIADYCNYKKGA